MPPLDPDRIREQSARLHRLAAAIVGDSLADDVLQDVWVAALDGPTHEPRSAAAWLSRVTRNLAWRRRIGDSRRRDREERASSSEASEALDEIVSRIEEGHLIECALLELDEPYRSALLWRYYNELSITEVSRRSGCTESTTRTHLQRGLERLRERLKSEHGPDWRLALLPFLRAEPVPPVAAGTLSAVLGGALVTTLTKSILIVAAVLAGWALFDRLSVTEEERPALTESETRPSTTPADATPSIVSATPAPDPDVMRKETLIVGDSLAADAPVAPPSTPARVVDPRCGIGIPGLRLTVKHDEESHELTTDDDGRVELPFDLTPGERTAPRPMFRAEALIPYSPGSQSQVNLRVGIPLDVRIREDPDLLELRLTEGWTAWVRLPVPVEETPLERFLATTSLRGENGRTTTSPVRYAPVLARGRDLLFVMPAPLVHDQGAPRIGGYLLELNLDARHGYSVALPREVSLADPPYLARGTALVTVPIVVRSDLTGLPVFGAFISLRERGRPNHAPVELASGHTDKDGLITFPVVRPGAALAVINRPGFELTTHEVEIIGDEGVLELDLHEVAGKSDLDVTVRLARGPVPGTLAVTIIEGRQENLAGSQFLEVNPDGSGGWNAYASFEDLPPGKCSIHVSTDLPGLGTKEPYVVELPVERAVIELDTPPPTRPLLLELPEGVPPIDFWIDDHDHLRVLCRGAYAGARLTRVTEEGRPRSWLVASEGHLPVFGREDAWKNSEDEHGDPIFVLAPQLEPGTGILIRVRSRGIAVANAEVRDHETGVLRATTDERGFALVRDAGSGDLLLVMGDGYQSRELRLGAGPFTTCELRKP